MSSPSDQWFQIYQQNRAPDGGGPPTIVFGGQTSDVTTVTTTTTTATTGAGPLSPIEGRVTKTARRRSRASRRTPTTLLNTDTENFRAMVQQFTGGPAPSFPTRPNFAFTLGSGVTGGRGAGAGAMLGSPSGFQYHNQNQQFNQQVQLQNQQQFMFSSPANGGGAAVGGGDHGFLQRLGRSEVSGGFSITENNNSTTVPNSDPTRRSSTSNENARRGHNDNFMF